MKNLFLTIVVLGSLATVTAAQASSYGPMAKCRDYTYSYSAHHQGTCSHHGGVKVWYR